MILPFLDSHRTDSEKGLNIALLAVFVLAVLADTKATQHS